MLDTRTVVQILNEDKIADRVKVEDLLSVALEARPAGLLVVPLELPDGPALGRAIDHTFSRSYVGIPPEGVPPWERLAWTLSTLVARVTRQPVAYKAFLVRDAFLRHIRRASSYKALRSWARTLGVTLVEGQVRPTIDEVYVGRGRAIASAAFDLQMMRSRIRNRFLRQYRQEGGSFRVFPEEADPEFTTGVGTLLGYPSCCIERYSGLRHSGEPVEQVAAAEARDGQPVPSAYFARDFMPCTPRCEPARAVGDDILAKLDALDPRLASIQARAFEDNVERVMRFPDIIKERQEQIQKKWEDVWLRGSGREDSGGPEERG